MTIKEIRQASGLSQAKFAEKHGIPVRTIEDWEAGRRKPPEYVVRLLEKVEKAGL
jgi:DNA-binding transcriptional regulator YiaG